MRWRSPGCLTLGGVLSCAAALCGCGGGEGGGDGGADADADIDADSELDSEPQPLPSPLEQVLISGQANLRTEETHSYTVDFDLTVDPYTVAARFSSGQTDVSECEGQGTLTADQQSELDGLLSDLRTCGIVPGGVEFCDLHTVQFFRTKASQGDSLTALKQDTGCSFIDRVLCARGPELYSFVKTAVVVETPADCPTGYLEYLDD